MAGDWLKVEVSLPDKPEVWQIAGMLGVDPDLVVGKLIKVWRWFDAHTEDGTIIGVPPSFVDTVAGVHGLHEAMVKVHWLLWDEASVSLPNFKNHNGKTAKSRCETAKRVAAHRSKSEKSNAHVTRELLPRPIISAVKSRDGARCVYCGRKEGEYAPPETSREGMICIDHVVPVSQGGSNEINNLVCACAGCNQFKSDRTPDECGLPWPVCNETGNRFGVTSALPREEKRREEEKQKKPSPVGDLLAGIDEKVAADFIRLRNVKKAPLTETALAGIRREAEKANLTLESALSLCCERGWTGFKAEWMAPRGQTNGSQPPAAGGGRRAL